MGNWRPVPTEKQALPASGFHFQSLLKGTKPALKDDLDGCEFLLPNWVRARSRGEKR